MDMRGMYNENPFDKPRKVTMDEIMMEKVEKMKKEVIEGERFRFKIPDNARPYEIIRLFSEAFDAMGIEIMCRDNYDGKSVMDFMTTTGLRNPLTEVYVRRISDQNIRRIMEIEERDVRLREKIRKEVEEEFRAIEAAKQNSAKIKLDDIKRIRELTGVSKESSADIIKRRKKEEEKKKKKRSKKKDASVFGDVNRRLQRDKNGKLNWTEGKSFEEVKDEPKNTEYQEKIKWFCEKYKQDYDIIYESFKDDDLDNLYWKGEKVEFPKK
jgi:hypothetical protein